MRAIVLTDNEGRVVNMEAYERSGCPTPIVAIPVSCEIEGEIKLFERISNLEKEVARLGRYCTFLQEHKAGK